LGDQQTYFGVPPLPNESRIIRVFNVDPQKNDTTKKNSKRHQKKFKKTTKNIMKRPPKSQKNIVVV
jgi:hypothetical protein